MPAPVAAGDRSEGVFSVEWAASETGYEVVDIAQVDVVELNRVGLAQDFDVHGTTGERTGRYCWCCRVEVQLARAELCGLAGDGASAVDPLFG
ncbi:hypothetical protein ABII15_28345 [Streptomyces sp. HUAS MG91]|uniref:Uncharacterized protein n=1 Tax=Streptomyces tabacisoli TaxID=3156398 RepID=A0AAU8IYR6_9ACTN